MYMYIVYIFIHQLILKFPQIFCYMINSNISCIFLCNNCRLFLPRLSKKKNSNLNNYSCIFNII